MIFKRPLFTCACLALVLLCQSTEAQDRTYRAPTASDGTLSWKFKKGQAIKVIVNQDTKTKMELPGMNMDSNVVAVNESTITTLAVDGDGTATTTNVVDRIKMATESPQASMDIDTADDQGADDSMSKMLKNMVGKPIEQKISKTGKVFDIKFPEGYFDGVEVDPMLGSMFNKEALEETSKNTALEFPQEKPEIGAKWDVTSKINMGPAQVETTTKYEYMGVADVDGKPQHVIRGEVSLSFPEGIQGADIDVTDEDSVAFFYFDGNAGRLTKTELKQDMVLEINAGGQVIKQVLNQKMTTEFKEVK